jgi:hypothetical protein
VAWATRQLQRDFNDIRVRSFIPTGAPVMTQNQLVIATSQSEPLTIDFMSALCPQEASKPENKRPL